MKYIKLFEAKIQKNLTDEEVVERDFKKAAGEGESSPYAENKAWTDVSNKYKLYDNYFIYDNCILQYTCSPSGNWYSHSLTKLEIKPSEFRKKIEEKIQKLENAIEKIDYGVSDEDNLGKRLSK